MLDSPFCCCFNGQRSDDEPADRDPVLLVSGIAGSILHSKKKNFFGFESRVWVRLLLADFEFRKEIWSLYNPETGYVESLDDSIEIVVPEDDYGLYAIDILDPALWVKILHLTEVYHFHDMIDMLVECGYKKGTTLFGHGFDFRQSNRIDKAMDGLKAKLETAYEASGGRKVNLISHSMGGLLVTCFMYLHNDVVECPSIYEMLPNPWFKWKKQPEILVWRSKSEEGGETSVVLESYGPTDSMTLFEEALKHNELDYEGKKFALPFNFSILKWANGTRQILNSAQLPKGIAFYNIYGISNDTPLDVCYGTQDSPIEEMSEICHTSPQYSYVDGDGTVPAESAKADNFEAVERVGVASSHRALLRDEKVFELVKKWLGVTEQVKSHPKKTSKVMDVYQSEC
ncbi:phospholipase A(1) LCAT3-like isoform X2 [Coffea arabica]|uniref:Phospholipase A(1) LCAT3-like isoform X2 n=1 Tax=Coffea arabica TaxID=13443 RepID=A0ABM4VRK2_COFAR